MKECPNASYIDSRSVYLVALQFLHSHDDQIQHTIDFERKFVRV